MLDVTEPICPPPSNPAFHEVLFTKYFSRSTSRQADIVEQDSSAFSSRGIYSLPVTDKIAIRLEGTGERVATDIAAAIDFIPFHSASRHFFSGKALTVVRAKHAKPGRTTVAVTVKELPPQQVFLTGIH